MQLKPVFQLKYHLDIDNVRKHRELTTVLMDVYRMGMNIHTFNIPQSEELLQELKDTLFFDMNKAKFGEDQTTYKRLAKDYE